MRFEGEAVRLTAGAMQLDLAPAMGGAILGWTDGGVALLRDSIARTAEPFSVRDCASFPLIPFSNRVAHGAFPFAGQVYQLPKDCRDPRHAMHGNALYAAWDVKSATANALELALAYRAGEGDAPFFPFSYDAEQLYRIGHDSLTIELTITNRDTRPFPAGLGHHLYFASEPDTTVSFEAENFWINGDDGLPARPADVGMDEFSRGHLIGSKALDNCFAGWQGTANIRRRSKGYQLHITATEALGHAVLFTPPGQPFFAFEPVSHLNDAIHRITPAQTHGLKILSPDETFRASILIRKIALQ